MKLISENNIYEVLEENIPHPSGKTYSRVRNILTDSEHTFTDNYIKNNTSCGTEFSGNVKKMSRTELVDTMKDHVGKAMSVKFYKKLKGEDIGEQVMNYLESLGNRKPSKSGISKYVKLLGEDRTMKGYLTSSRLNEHGRFTFYDAEEKHRSPVKTIDPRTVYEIIVDNTCYQVKDK